MTENYINSHIVDIKKHGDAIENRISKDIDLEELVKENKKSLEMCQRYKLGYILIDDNYIIDFEIDNK